ncbi:hypothetical protein BH10PLA2_BH10PLA2_33970 [soil metagenome]
MTTTGPVRVVGMGSPNADDALAWTVISELELASGDYPEVEFHRVMGGHQLLDRLDGRGILILIDALSGCGPIGTVHSFTWPDARVDSLSPRSTHLLGAADALRLAETVGSLPPQVLIVGVEAECFAAGESLSPQVRAAVPLLVQQVQQLLDASLRQGNTHQASMTWGG